MLGMKMFKNISPDLVLSGKNCPANLGQIELAEITFWKILIDFDFSSER